MTDARQTVLIIEDDLDVAEMLNAYFRVQAYEVLTAAWGEDGVRAAQNALPDLIILDIRLPDIDGFEVASRLRANHRTRQIPIIFLTEKRQRLDRIKGLELGADDYITKPFDIQELRLRVRNSLRRASQGPLTNPVTNLPEGDLVDERLAALLQNPGDQAVLLVRIENLDDFRETFGFVAADDALRAISLMVQTNAQDLGGPDPYVGHLQAADFLVITTPAQYKPLQDQIHTHLAQSIDLFYPVNLRENQDRIARRMAIRTGVLGERDIAASVDLPALKKRLEKSVG